MHVIYRLPSGVYMPSCAAMPGDCLHIDPSLQEVPLAVIRELGAEHLSAVYDLIPRLELVSASDPAALAETRRLLERCAGACPASPQLPPDHRPRMRLLR